MDVVLLDFISTQIVIPVPLPFEMVLDETDIVAEAERSVVVDNAMQVVEGLNLERILEELCIAAEACCIEVPNWEVNQVLKFAPLITIQAEPLQLNDQDRWGNKNLHPLEVDLWSLALFSLTLVLELFSLAKLGHAVVESGVVSLVNQVKILFLRRSMLNHLASQRIIIFGKLF